MAEKQREDAEAAATEEASADVYSAAELLDYAQGFGVSRWELAAALKAKGLESATSEQARAALRSYARKEIP